MIHSIQTLIVLAGLASAELAPRQSTTGVDITALNKNVSATSGTGAVSAAGTLAPFGAIGVGCGVNWAEGQSYGGGLQSGSDSFGLGGGFTITEDTMNIGLGIGINGPQGLNTSVTYQASTNGTASIIFTSTKGVTCQETTVDGLKGFQCISL
ncbi:hypothetical protein CGRA01v4_04627 [Colletotrichum graminicola]|uniref:Uncharacterized protein n=1 Tax=Colletotrichum graminicola (strain M1.001 / M2 / FGSC 10212) TaxID=645133 RepID=E3Q910_COLGM|nr:uncharacterized protein GLRG_02019 [Colletotrichum graminicola M1.001]EFQ27524.1 hypothetical protein GLRG_02019 [Colletotrichum graminicola M1.001]WDK13346.1 hypothetical protein CGRA01v4_04627 [Colletotrichum graminicola]